MILSIWLRQWILLLACVLVTACAVQPPAPQVSHPRPSVSPQSLESTRPELPALSAEDLARLAEQIRSGISHLPEDSRHPVSVQGMSLKQGVDAFYRLRGYRPAWHDPALLDQLLLELADLHYDGLDSEEYSLSSLKQKRDQLSKLTSVSARAELDLLATRSCMLALIHLYRGRLDPNQLDPQWNFPTHALNPQAGVQALNEAVTKRKLADVFDRARPQQPVYLQLRNGLRQLYAIEEQGGWAPVPDGPTLKAGMRDARVPLLRKRLVLAGALGKAYVEGKDYDATVEAAVKRFQQEQNLDIDGAVGKQTRAVLNVPVAARIDQVRANLERSRWLLHEVKGDFVLVDIAGYRIHFFRDGKSVWTSRVQVGRPVRSTPIFKSKVTYVTFNPTWTIPPTIFKEDVLPKVKADPEYLAKNRIRVLGPGGKELDVASIDWSHPGNVLLREDAGEQNPLGKAVIRFPNPHSIYLHDTPTKANFGRGQRAFSSGCIRVERPLELVELLFNDPQKWNREGIDAAIATGETKDYGLSLPVPILLTYSTVGLASDGRVVFKQDIYDRDPALIAALNRRGR